MIPFNSHITKDDIQKINNFLENATDDSGLVHDKATLPIKTLGSYHIVVNVFHVDSYNSVGVNYIEEDQKKAEREISKTYWQSVEDKEAIERDGYIILEGNIDKTTEQE